MLELAGRRAIVTGASKGLGRDIARALAGAQVKVALVARPSHELDQIAAELGDAAVACPCNIRSSEQVGASVARAAETLGGIDFLINNAALFSIQRVEDLRDDALQAEFETNLFAPFRFCRQVIPHLRASGRGHIINITSETVRDPHPFASVYAATKAGMETLTMSLKHELREDRVRTTTFRVGKMETGTIHAQWPPGLREAYLSACEASGHLARSGAPLAPTTAAAAIVDILRLPDDANVDLFELRGR